MKDINYSFFTYSGSQVIEKENNYIHHNNLFVIIDGVGKEYLGSKASNLACRTIFESFFKYMEKLDSPSDAIAYSLQEANRVILNERIQINEKMAASVCILFIQNKIMYFSHMGDSRIYLFQDNELNQLTRDHTLREEDPFAEKRYDDPRALQALIKGLGIHEAPDIYIKKYPLEKKGMVVLTTERLTERISNRDIQWLSRKVKNPKKLCKSIIELFRRKGGDEGFTLGIIRYGITPKWIRKILSIYVISFLIIIVGVSLYMVRYGDNSTNEMTTSVETKPIVVEDRTGSQSTEIRKKVIKRPQPEKVTAVRHPVAVEKNEPTSVEIPTAREKKLKSDLDARVHDFLDEWKTAWEMSAGKNGDIARYISFYTDDFKSGRLDKKGWASDKSRKNRRKKWIRIEVTNIKISNPDKENRITVSFSQNYRSSNFSVKSDKKLILEKSGDRLLIRSEQSD